MGRPPAPRILPVLQNRQAGKDRISQLREVSPGFLNLYFPFKSRFFQDWA